MLSGEASSVRREVERRRTVGRGERGERRGDADVTAKRRDGKINVSLAVDTCLLTSDRPFD